MDTVISKQRLHAQGRDTPTPTRGLSVPNYANTHEYLLTTFPRKLQKRDHLGGHRLILYAPSTVCRVSTKIFLKFKNEVGKKKIWLAKHSQVPEKPTRGILEQTNLGRALAGAVQMQSATRDTV